MATAPVAYQSALIESLRAASPGFTSNNSGVTMLPNPANSTLTINFLRGPRTGLINNPQAFSWPTVAPAPAPGPVPAPPPGGGDSPIVIGPSPAPSIGPQLPPITPPPTTPPKSGDDDFVGPPVPPPSPSDDNFVGPPDDFVGPPAPDDDFVGPPAPDEDVAQPLPVPDPAPPDVVDLPPLPPSGGDDDFVGPLPDDFVGPMPDDFVGPMPDDFVGPMPDDFVGPPEPPKYDEIPEGEIEIGPPGDSQPARDVIDQIGDITEVGDPLDELGEIDLPDPVIDPPPIPPPSSPGEGDFVDLLEPDDDVTVPDYTEDLWPPVYDEIPEGEIEVGPPGSSQPARDAINEIGDITEVGDPLDELGDIGLLEPVIEPPFIPPVGGDDFVGPMPYIPSDDDFVGPMPDDFVGPPAPEYDEIPEGEIDVVAPGSSQLARDAIDRIGDITEVGDPLDELGDLELSDFVIDSPSVPSAGDDFVGPMPDDFVGPMPDEFVGPMPDEFVGPMPDDLGDAPATVPDYTNDLWGSDAGGDVTPDYTNDLWGPEEPALTDQDYFEMALFDLMAQELLTGGGGSGRPGNNMNILAYE